MLRGWHYRNGFCSASSVHCRGAQAWAALLWAAQPGPLEALLRQASGAQRQAAAPGRRAWGPPPRGAPRRRAFLPEAGEGGVAAVGGTASGGQAAAWRAATRGAAAPP